MKDRCAISYGLIRTTVVGGAFLPVALVIRSDKTSRKLSTTTMA